LQKKSEETNHKIILDSQLKELEIEEEDVGEPMDIVIGLKILQFF
jgi:hypothetical protein